RIGDRVDPRRALVARPLQRHRPPGRPRRLTAPAATTGPGGSGPSAVPSWTPWVPAADGRARGDVAGRHPAPRVACDGGTGRPAARPRVPGAGGAPRRRAAGGRPARPLRERPLPATAARLAAPAWLPDRPFQPPHQRRLPEPS